MSAIPPKADIGLVSASHSTHRSYLQRVMDNSLQIVRTAFTAIDLVGRTMTPGDYIFAAAMTVVIVWLVAEVGQNALKP
jgi:hypothetical protein